MISPDTSRAPAASRPVSKPSLAGWANGLAAVIIFSGSLPATRCAVADLSPLFLTSARGGLAALIAAVLLAIGRQPRPQRDDLVSLAVVALGVVIGFPLLTAMALRLVTSAHSMVFIALLPLATAIFGVLRCGERPRLPFWIFCSLGSGAVMAFSLAGNGAASLEGDLLMIGAVVACGLGYAEGARLTRRLGGWQVICWALVIAAPIMLPLMALNLPASWSGIGLPAWLGLAYVTIFSMLIGFIFWYRGLASGGVASVGQLQLLQPFFGLGLSGLLLHEPVEWTMIVAASLVALCVAFARRFA